MTLNLRRLGTPAFPKALFENLIREFSGEVDVTVVYSGDAVECPALRNLARDATVFVCECSFPRGWHTCDHVTADGAGRMAQTANARRLVLSHLYPPAQEADVAGQARAEYEGEVVVAVDGTIVKV